MWTGFEVCSSIKGLCLPLVGTPGHFKLNIAWGLLAHTVESWPHTHKTSGSWLKTLKGGFSFLQFHLELSQAGLYPHCLPLIPQDLTEGLLIQWSSLFMRHFYICTFLVGSLVILGYELLLDSARHAGILMASAWAAVFRRAFAL